MYWRALLYGFFGFVVIVMVTVLAFALFRTTSHASVVVDQAVRHQSGWLCSELRIRDGKKVSISEEYHIRNQMRNPMQLHFLGTDCGCVHATANGAALQRNAVLELAKGQSLLVALQFAPPAHEGCYSYRGMFQPEVGDAISVSFDMAVYADTKAEPGNVAVCLAEDDGGVHSKTVSVWHASRSRATLASSVRFTALPKSVSLASVTPVGDPVELEAGLFRQRFDATFDISGYEGLRHDVGTMYAVFDSQDHAEVANLAIPVSVRRTRAIDFVEEIDFGFVPGGETRSRRVVLAASGSQPFHIIRIETSSPTIEAKTEESAGAGNRQWVNVVLTPSKAEADKGWIRIETDHPQCPAVQIAIKAMLQGD